MNELEIYDNVQDDALTLELHGAMNASNSSRLFEAAKAKMGQVRKVILDMQHLEYSSSSGLRQIMMIHSVMKNKGGKTIARHVNEEMQKILTDAGFQNFLEIEA